MKNTNTQTDSTNNPNLENTDAQGLATGAKAGSEVEVLYQKMGDRWFAFSLVDEEVFIGSITQAEIDSLEYANAPGADRKIAGNS